MTTERTIVVIDAEHLNATPFSADDFEYLIGAARIALEGAPEEDRANRLWELLDHLEGKGPMPQGAV